MNQMINFTIGASLGATFGANLTKAKTQLTRLDTQLKELSDQKNRFSGLEIAEKNASNLREKISQTSESVQTLKLRLKNAADPKDQQQIQTALTKQLALRDRLSISLEKETNLIRAQKTQLGSLIGQRERINIQLDKALTKQAKLNGLSEQQEAITDKKSELKGGLVGVATIGASLALPIKQAVDFESAMADVKKVVDFQSPAELKVMEADILRLTRTLPMTAQGISSIMASAGQAGIAKNELLGFAESAAKMGVAFDVTADEAGDMMAKWRTAFKMNQSQVNTLADQINFLGNTTAASAPKISDVVRRIGPLGEVGGLAAGQIAAIGASMVSTGVESEVAATAIKNFMLSTVAGASATKSQKEAYKSLGIDAEKLAKRMQVDAGGAIDDLLTRLQKLPKHMQAATMKELFGSESIGAIAPLLTNLDALRGNLAKVGDATQYAGSMNAEFEARAATTANSFQLMSNKLGEIGISIGSILLPAVNSLLDKVSPLITGIADFTRENENLVKGVLAVGGALMTFKIGMMAASYGILAAKGAMIALNIAMTANPIGLLIKGVALLGIGLAAAWPHLKQGSDAFWEFSTKVEFALESAWQSITGAWESIKTTFNDGINWIVGIGSTIASGLQTAFSFSPIGLIVNNFEAIKTYLTGLIADFGKIGTDIIDGLVGGITRKFNLVTETISNLGSSIANSFKSVLGIKSPSRVMIEAGKDTAEGISVGLQRGEQGPLTQMSGLGKALGATLLATTAVISPIASNAMSDIQLLKTEYVTKTSETNQIDTQSRLSESIKSVSDSVSLFGDKNESEKPDLSFLTPSVSQPDTKASQVNQGAQVAPIINQTYTINIQQQPGQDAQDIARQVMAEINRQQALSRSRAMGDWA